MSFDLGKLEDIVKTKLNDESIFKTSFTHRSYLNEHSEYKNPSNERLEFLGDAVLQLLSSEYLYQQYPQNPEGDLTNYRSAIVCTQSISHEAKRLGYGQLLLLSNGEESTGGRDREYILANTFEAVLGALFIDKGLDFCREFTTRELFYKVENIVTNKLYKDSKSRFQEAAQEKTGLTPLYEVENSWGPDHEKMFKVAVYLGKEKYGEGEGKSKQKAEQQAAENALSRINS